MGREITRHPVERDKLRIIDLWNIDAEAVVHCGDEVQKVHRIDVDRFAQISFRVDARHIDRRHDIVQLMA